MSTIIVELDDPPEEKGRAAAQALANYDSCLSRIEAELLVLK